MKESWEKYAAKEFDNTPEEIEELKRWASLSAIPMRYFRVLALAADKLVETMRCGGNTEEDVTKALKGVEKVLGDLPAFHVTHVEYCKRNSRKKGK